MGRISSFERTARTKRGLDRYPLLSPSPSLPLPSLSAVDMAGGKGGPGGTGGDAFAKVLARDESG